MSRTPELQGRHDPSALVGRILAERYRVVELLGSGGMGSVYRVEHVGLRRMVALKLMHPAIAARPGAAQRFEREAEAASRLQHPNVIAVTDFGRLGSGEVFLVMEFVAGRSLAQLIEREAPLDASRALFIARQCANALAHVHAAGVVHRDLKPANVLLSVRNGSFDWVKVVDFGIAQVLSSNQPGERLTSIGVAVGTRGYMSPEQARGQLVDGRSDLYNLGLILLEMLGGPSATPEELIPLSTRPDASTGTGAPLVPTAVAALTVDPLATGVRSLIERLLEERPEARPQTASEVVDRIDELLASEMPTLETSRLAD